MNQYMQVKMRNVTLEEVKPVLFAHVPAAQADELSTEKPMLDPKTIPDSDLIRSAFIYDLGLDSMEFVLFCLDLERKLDIKIDLTAPDIELDPRLNLGDFLRHINLSLCLK